MQNYRECEEEYNNEERLVMNLSVNIEFHYNVSMNNNGQFWGTSPLVTRKRGRETPYQFTMNFMLFRFINRKLYFSRWKLQNVVAKKCHPQHELIDY